MGSGDNLALEPAAANNHHIGQLEVDLCPTKEEVNKSVVRRDSHFPVEGEQTLHFKGRPLTL